jgi:hypothetical protein
MGLNQSNIETLFSKEDDLLKELLSLANKFQSRLCKGQEALSAFVF